jgi:hypothetical protein
MPKLVLLFILSMSLMHTGCATSGKSALLGAGIGATAGATLGVLANQNDPPGKRTQGALIGAGLGGLFGALMGHGAYKEQQKKAQADMFDVNSGPGLEVFGSAGENGNRPILKPARVRVRYVEDQIKDGTFVPAHFEYEIVEPARFEKSK